MNLTNIITPEQLKDRLNKKEDIFIVDIRIDTDSFSPIDSAVHISVTQIFDKIELLPKNKIIVLYCYHGVDSFFLMNILVSDYNLNVFSLKGGIEAWHS